MATSLNMSATRSLLDIAGKEDRFQPSAAELLPIQLQAIDERFQDRVGKIKLLQNRAETGGISEIRRAADVVPLLFAHTAYKSYPETWLFEQKWDRLARWLGTVSSFGVAPVQGEIDGLDDWLKRLEEQGHYVSCSSGTTGKCAMMDGTMADLTFAADDLLSAIRWTGLNPANDRRIVGLGQVAMTTKNMMTGRPMAEAFSLPGIRPFSPDVPPITIGGILEMVLLRKKMADGTAKPSEVAHYDAVSAQREKDMASSLEQAADALIESRHMPLHILGMLGPLFKVAELVRARGYSGKDFQPNSSFLSGGLKRAQVPDDYRDYIFDTFNLADERICQTYGMQEINSQSPRCTHGRYHVPPWMLLLLLDESGEQLVEPQPTGEHEGRAALFDLSLEGRWGGVISGDKIKVRWDRCGCGNHSPSIHADIQRYADTAGGDKIACSGTIDAYVRGAA
ncbi:hypothetical protein LWE61_17315 [Sphingobium sufflavum]|uniref:hypothetical protein n=1 Tax=Sphingobium sufflavum TaxID=1129547 RepID=UPI001F3D5F20|nr:hypothetical protein [Sphingobium sufflavum]MCE7798299.1 hypothetical protein [Sphingobium sufflavum]